MPHPLIKILQMTLQYFRQMDSTFNFQVVLWTRIGFKADPDLKDSGSKINADPDQTLNSQKVEFLHEKFCLKLDNFSKNKSTKVQKLLRQKTMFIC